MLFRLVILSIISFTSKFSKSISSSLNNVLIDLNIALNSPVSVISPFTLVSSQTIDSLTTSIPPFSFPCNFICSIIVSQIIWLPKTIPSSSFSPFGLLFRFTTLVINVLIFDVILSKSIFPSPSTNIFFAEDIIALISFCHSFVVNALTLSEIVIVPSSPISVNILAIVSVIISLATKSSYFSSLILVNIWSCLLVSLPIKSSYTELPFSSTKRTFAVVIIFLISAFHKVVWESVQSSARNLSDTTKNESSASANSIIKWANVSTNISLAVNVSISSSLIFVNMSIYCFVSFPSSIKFPFSSIITSFKPLITDFNSDLQ